MRKKQLAKSLMASLLSAALIITTAGSVFATEPASGAEENVPEVIEAVEAVEVPEVLEAEETAEEEVTFNLEGASLTEYSGLPASSAPGSDDLCDFDYMSNEWLPAVDYEALSSERYTEDAFRKATTKKGIQGMEDIDATRWKGSQHTLYNVDVVDVIWSPNPRKGYSAGKMRWDYNGKAYYYNVNYLFSLVKFVQTANKNGVTVTMQFQYPYHEGMEELLDPTALSLMGNKPADCEYFAPNNNSEYLDAFYDMMVDIFSRTNCHVDCWAVGNEVNAPNSWHYTGSVDPAYNVNMYVPAYQKLYNIVRKYSGTTRVAVCLDHSWQHDNGDGSMIPTKTFLDLFNAGLAGTPAASDWCLATHMYPALLWEPDIWVGLAHTSEFDFNPRSEDARLVDGYNFYLLTDYIKNNFGSKHRVMCTEQGFSDNMGDDVQAAALALSYYTAKYDDMVDSFILVQKDHTFTVDLGWAGVYTCNYNILGKTTEVVYELLDSNPTWVENMTLPVIGISSYTDLIPNYGQQTRVLDEKKTKAFVSRIYDLALKRDHDDSEVNYWKDELANGMTGAEVAGGFFFSPEMKSKNLTDKEFLTLCYEVMMGRTPDEAEMQYWLDAMKEGFGREGVFNNFCQSKEFTGICIDTGIIAGEYPVHGRSLNIGLSGFMSRLYTKALGRAFDGDGMDYWCDEYTNGNYSLLEISTNQFFHSPEFEAKGLSEEQYIDVLYQTFFGRACDDTERAYWINELHTEKTKDEVLSDFSVCKEFGEIKAAFGLQ